MAEIFRVSELNDLIKNTLDREYLFKNCFITGSISNLKKHSNGCYYFSLKDEDASIDVTIFSNYLRGQAFAKEMENGLTVTLRGSLNFYEKMGRISFLCQDVIIGGKSGFQIAYEELKKELTALGYFDERYKKPLPLMPTCIGIVTSESGAVLHDILHIAKKRNPLVTFKLFSVPVQGDSAPPYIVKGIKKADKDPEVEVIIVGRGGGSLEDLWCFNDRRVIEAIFECQTPIISAIGHETDYTLSDFAADVRGATPSHATEISVYPLINLKEELTYKYDFIQRKIQEVLLHKKQNLVNIVHQKLSISLIKIIQREEKRLFTLKDKLIKDTKDRILEERQQLILIQQRLELLNPLSLMLKGYTKAVKGKTVLHSIDQVNVGDKIELVIKDGIIRSEVKEIIKNGK